MTTKILERLSVLLQTQIDSLTADIIGSPKIAAGNEDFRWKCGYVSALQQIHKEINNMLIKGEDAE